MRRVTTYAKSDWPLNSENMKIGAHARGGKREQQEAKFEGAKNLGVAKFGEQ